MPGWVRNYQRDWLRGDVVAGLTVGAATIPAALAYAQLAGLPAVHGLYASVVPALLYAALGTSRHLQIGPGSTLSILVAASLSGLLVGAEPGEAVALAALLALMSGAMLVAAGLLRLGFIADFLSSPVLTGFTAGAALLIISSQLPKLFGVSIEADSFFETVWETAQALDDANGPTVVISAATIAALLGMKRWLPTVPASLIVVVVGIVVVALGDLTAEGVAVVGEIQAGLPGPEIPSLGRIDDLFGAALAVSLLVYVETIAVSREFSAKHGYRIDANRELVASGAANLGAGVFQGFSVDGSFSQSALNDASGARTQMAGVVTALLVAVVLVGLTGLLADLPNAVLGAIIIVAVLGLINVREMRRLYRVQRPPGPGWDGLPARADFGAAIITFAGTLVLGILQGVLIGVSMALLALVYRATRPNVAVLGESPEWGTYRDISRIPGSKTHDGLLIVRWSAELFFANAGHFRDQIQTLIAEAEQEEGAVRAVLLDASAITNIDVTGADTLARLAADLEAEDRVLLIARARGPVRDMFAAAGLDQAIPERHRFESVRDGAAYFELRLAGLDG
jgi:high affinity sulfate transporter 1